MEPANQLNNLQSQSQDEQPEASELKVSPQKKSLQTPAALQTQYHFIRELGHGTQGKIFLAENLADRSRVAIKQLRIESVKNWKAYDLFKRESDVLASLHIDGIAKFYESIECLEGDDPCAWIVQEYIPGRSLQDLLRQGHRFDVHTVYDIALQVLAILEKLHNHVPPIIHRDIKPSNLLLVPLNNNQYKVYLIDFGAVANPQIQGGGSTVAGTYGYMAPEQLMGKPGPACDIYALAAVVVYLMCGVSPADMPVRDFHLIFEPEMQSAHPSVVNVLRQMLEPRVEERLADIEQLKTIFAQFKNDKYLLNDISNQSEWSSLQLNNKLREVQEYGEAGNIELWQRLSETTPRSIPDYYNTKLLNYQQLELDNIIVASNTAMFTSLWGKIIGYPIMVALSPLAMGFLIGDGACAIEFFILASLFIIFPKQTLTGYIIAAVVISSLVFFSNLGDKFSGKKNIKEWSAQNRQVIAKRQTTNQFYRNDQEIHQIKRKVLEEGRKTIARITNIEYVPFEKDMFKFNHEYIDFGLTIEKAGQPEMTPEQPPETEQEKVQDQTSPDEQNHPTTKNTWNGFAQKELQVGRVFKKDFPVESTRFFSTKASSDSPASFIKIKQEKAQEPTSPIEQDSQPKENTDSGFARKDWNSGPVFKKDFPINSTRSFSTKASGHPTFLPKSNTPATSSISSKSFSNNDDEEEENETPIEEKKFLPFMAVYYGAPTFKISYAFNPPDDLREEDIIHECYIHYDPEDHLKVGDALPILYFIERHHNGITIQPDSDGVFRQDKEAVTYECVTSMPFPFPLSDPIDERDILCCSEGK